jgi:hypothetical protein
MSVHSKAHRCPQSRLDTTQATISPLASNAACNGATPSATNQSSSRICVSSRTTRANEKAAPIAESGRLEFQRLAFIVDLVGFFLPLSFSPGSCTRGEGFMVTLAINKDDP